MVAHLTGGQGVAGSNPVSPTVCLTSGFPQSAVAAGKFLASSLLRINVFLKVRYQQLIQTNGRSENVFINVCKYRRTISCYGEITTMS